MKAVLAAALLAFCARDALAQAPAAQFATDLVYNSPNGITTLVFEPSGHLLAAEKQGRIVRFAPNGSGGHATPPTVFADFVAQVDPAQESGLLGLALDPDYANNRYVYVFHTTPTDQRLVRLVANAGFTAIEPGSAQVLLSGLPRGVTFHKAGDIHFSPADPTAIYVALGDDGLRGVAQNPDRYEGKILRVDAATGRGLADNPFYAGNADAVRARVWAIGLRNPFRVTFHPGQPSRTVLYSSENGDATDRLSRIVQGSNGAWSQAGDGGGFLSPPDTNHRVLATSSPFVIGIAISSSGPFGSNVLYWGRGGQQGFTLRRFQLSGAGFEVATPLDGGGTFLTGQSPIDLKFGPDGHLYGTTAGNGASTSGGPFPIRRVRFAGGAAPSAAFSVSPGETGPAPFAVGFADQSSDDGMVVSRAWQFGDGAVSAEASPGHVYASPGVYVATLTVTDDSGLQASATRTLSVTRDVALSLDALVRDGRIEGGPGFAAATELRFYQSDGSTPAAIVGAASGNVLPVPAGGALAASLTLRLTGDALVVSAGEAAGDGVHGAFRGLVVPAGAGPHAASLEWFLSDTMVQGRVRDTRGAALAVDVGVARTDAAHAVVGGRDFLAGSGHAATGAAHRVESDALGWYHVALRAADAGSFTLDAVADTGHATHARVAATRAVGAGANVRVDFVSGLWMGGVGCDDLGAIQPLPSIDYATQVQPIWDGACTGCHAPNVTNSGGLDLTPGASLAGLVGVPGVGAPGVPRVTPGMPNRSFLMEKIGCAAPQAGTRMRPANAMATNLQATVRDWIASLPVASAEAIFANGFE